MWTKEDTIGTSVSIVVSAITVVVNNGIMTEVKRRKNMIQEWELEKVKDWTTNEIRNHIWMATNCGQPVPGNVSVEALRAELTRRGEEPVGYHNT